MGQIIQPTSDDTTNSVIAMKDDGQLTRSCVNIRLPPDQHHISDVAKWR